MDLTMSRENMSADDKKAIATLSFEKYLADSVESFKAIKKSDNELLQEDRSLESELNIIRKTYKSMSRESAEAEETKLKFSDKIKNWFIKVWSVIADIFVKIQEVVLQLVKALIIFIQKKRVQATSLINILKDNGIRGLDVSGKTIYETLKENEFSIRVPDLEETLKDIPVTKPLPQQIVHSLLANNMNLQEFVKSPIIAKNKDSIFNTESLIKYFEQDIIRPEDVDEQKLTNLEVAINYLYAQAVFFGEVSPNHAKSNSIMRLMKDELDAQNITNVAHFITMGTTKPVFKSIPLIEYFGCDQTNNEKVFKKAWTDYINDTKLVLDPNGYISTIEETLKRYKDIAANDAKNIKIMKDFITKQLNTIGTGETEADQKAQHKIKRFTKLIIGVKNVKNHFIRLRQTVILDLITLYSIENRAWYLASGKKELIEKYKDLDDERKILPDETTNRPNMPKNVRRGEFKLDMDKPFDPSILYRQGDEQLKNN